MLIRTIKPKLTRSLDRNKDIRAVTLPAIVELVAQSG